MYPLLILFFASLLGIAIMIGRKLSLVRNGHAVENYHAHPFVPDLERLKFLTVKSIRRSAYLMIFITIRFYLLSSNAIKTKFEETRIKLKERSMKTSPSGEKQEISKFLKVISDYKRKIRDIKHKIKQQEKI